MNPNKNAQTYLNKYIKTQNPNNQEEKQTTKHKKSLSYRINKQINIRKQRFHREESNKTTLDKQEKNIH